MLLAVPIQSVKEAVNSELLAARDFFVEVDHKEAGRVKFPGAPYKLSETPWRVKRPAPMLGEHNDEVYCKMLGYSRQRFGEDEASRSNLECHQKGGRNCKNFH